MEKYSVKKPFTVLVAVLIVFLLGFVSVTNLRTDLLPGVSTPYLMVVTVPPGASPEKVETEVSEVLESALGTVAGVSSITSTSAENYSIVQLSFAAGTDMNSAMVKVSNTLDQNADSLPDICLTPSILELSMDMSSLMTVAVGREGADIYELSSFLEESVIPELERQEGVSSISTTGLISQYIQVQLNEEKIDALNVLLLEQVDTQLALAKEQLDAAAAQLAGGRAQLQQAIDTFGNVFASGVVERVGGGGEGRCGRGVGPGGGVGGGGGRRSSCPPLNRRNERAIGAYRRAGFREVRAQVTDIGGGYVMDDYVMELETTLQKE